MKIITHEVEGVWVRFTGNPHLDARKVALLINEGVWNDNDLQIYGLRSAEPFVVPEGKIIAGPERFENEGRQQVFDVEDAPPAPVPDAVSSRQFKMQLAIAGLKTSVEAWVATQDELVQIAYESSATFVRSEPMMQAGFAALGFTTQQIDHFFTEAAQI